MSGRSMQETRAHWQRTEGMVIFDAELRELLPATTRSITDAEIVDTIDTLNASDHGLSRRSVDLCHEFGDLIVHKSAVSPNEKLVKQRPERAISSSLPANTHNGLNYGLYEGFLSSFHFPLNLIEYAEIQALVQGRPNLWTWTMDVSSITQTLRSPWFQQFCHDASYTVNGTWLHLSQDAHARPDRHHLPYIQLDYYFQEDEPAFRFSPDSLANLRKRIRDRNKIARDPQKYWFEDNDEYGTSSGCPVRHTRPQFTSKRQDQRRLSELAQYYGKSPAKITAPRPESGISFSLNQFADFLDRVHVIDQGLMSDVGLRG